MRKKLTECPGIPRLIFKEEQISQEAGTFSTNEKKFKCLSERNFVKLPRKLHYSHGSLCSLRRKKDKKLFYSKSKLPAAYYVSRTHATQGYLLAGGEIFFAVTGKRKNTVTRENVKAYHMGSPLSSQLLRIS